MRALASRAGLIWETYYPAFSGLVCGTSVYFFAPNLFSYIKTQGYSYATIYQSMFDLASVATGFLFTFYTFVITTEKGFIGKTRGTRPYRLLLSYTARAMTLGTVFVILSVPVMIVGPCPVLPTDTARVPVGIWFGLLAWTVGAFIRAAWLFAIFAEEHS